LEKRVHGKGLEKVKNNSANNNKKHALGQLIALGVFFLVTGLLFFY